MGEWPPLAHSPDAFICSHISKVGKPGVLRDTVARRCVNSRADTLVVERSASLNIAAMLRVHLASLSICVVLRLGSLNNCVALHHRDVIVMSKCTKRTVR